MSVFAWGNKSRIPILSMDPLSPGNLEAPEASSGGVSAEQHWPVSSCTLEQARLAQWQGGSWKGLWQEALAPPWPTSEPWSGAADVC